MVNSIGSANINPIQMFSAMNAFKAIQTPTQPQVQDISEGIDINDNALLKNQDIKEIQEYAKNAGESNITEDDIKYGITYGRSVIADYIA